MDDSSRSVVIEADIVFDFRELVFEHWTLNMSCGSKIHVPVLEVNNGTHPENPVRLLMKSVITELILHIKKDEKTTGHTYGQPGNIQHRI
jgi:hypothetical protein